MAHKLILTNYQSPGDIVMLTAAVCEPLENYPGQFLTDVRTPCPHLWENNPYTTALYSSDPMSDRLLAITRSSIKVIRFLTISSSGLLSQEYGCW